VSAQLLRASGPGEPWAVEQLRIAAKRALGRGVPEAATRYLTRALEEPSPRSGLQEIPGLRTLRLWPDATERVGVATFTLAGYPHPLLAAILSAEHAIGVRHGCFCAHPLITRLLGVSDEALDRLRGELKGRRPQLPGAVRASVGLGTTPGDIDRLIAALGEIAGSGPRWRYRHVVEHDEYEPVERLAA
jgi:selenocysteine lyase/cysteine desulfurase